ncbi:MAG: UbiD family decarboxylase [Hyphomicrobiales bacterium]|nr:UbiD family decarboxylase [Hyphomicrobiales bacterium]
MAYYRSIREFVNVLDAHKKLFRIKREINKDTELMPLVKWEFRGLPEKERRAFLFENVTDAKQKRYDGSVLVAANGGSRDIYAMAMNCKPEELVGKWDHAMRNPIPFRVVEDGVVQEEIHVGSGLLEHGGLDEFPVPISTPGFDNAPYTTGGVWISKNPITGAHNAAIYRGMVKSQLRLGCFSRVPQDLAVNLNIYRQKGIPMPAAVVFGATPNIGVLSVAKIPYDVDEMAVAGAIAGEPVEMVKCQTIDLCVPATAEIVLEGEIPVDLLESEAPFGEYTGYMGLGVLSNFFNIKCITHRKNPIVTSFIGAFPPSEGSTMITVYAEAELLNFLRNTLRIDCVADVALRHEIYPIVVLSIKQGVGRAQVWKALHGANAFDNRYGKIIIALDDDIDPRDADSVLWGLCYGMQPDRDVQISGRNKISLLDPTLMPPDQHGTGPITSSMGHLTSTMIIDATRKWQYPPISLPKKEFMDRAKQIWEEEGLPPLNPKAPWFGQSLGLWTKENEEEADLAVKGEYYKTGEKHAKHRTKI